MWAAEKGCRDLILTHDVSDYLTSSSLSSSYPNKSHEITFDYRMSSYHGYSGEAILSTHTILSVTGTCIKLEQPYEGRNVSCGQPFVNIRTKLTMQSFRKASECNGVEDTSVDICTLPYPAKTSCICCHSILPYAIIGFENGDIKILGIQSPDLT